MKTSRVNFFVCVVLAFTLFQSCRNNHASGHETGPDLVIYCENGILGPLKEIATNFEDSTGLQLSIQNDCARNLTSLIHYRNEADIFIPDAKQGLEKLFLSSPDIIKDSVSLGEQKLLFIVAKSNPAKLSGSINTLTDPANGIILANPESSTLGHISGSFLKKHQIYDQVMNSVLFLTADSRSLVRNIASNHASLAIAWESDYLTNSIRKKADTLSIQSSFLNYPAMAVSLTSGKNQKNAAHFLKELQTTKSKKIFEKYGITTAVPNNL